MKKILLLVICLLFTTGCYDYHELTDMNIVNGIGINYKDDEYVVNLEMVTSSKSDQSNSIKTNIISASDKEFADAINKATNNSGKKAYFKHVDLIIISEELAKKGIEDVVDYMLRDVSMSSNFFTVIAEDPEEILNTELDNDSISNLIIDTIRYNVDSVQLDNIDLIASNILNEKKDIALPYIVLDDDNIKIEEIAYFKKTKMLDKIDSKIYNFLMLKSNNLDFDNDGNIINVFKKSIKYDITKEKIIINIKGMGKVKKVNPSLDLEKKDSYKIIEDLINETIYNETIDFLKETLDNEADLIGFKDLYYKFYMKEKDNIPYEINVDINVNRNGAIYEAIHD